MAVLADAVAYWQASNYSGSGDWLDEGGGSHDGAITGAQFRALNEGQHLYLPGSANNWARCADDNTLDLTSDLELIWAGSLTDMTPSDHQSLVAKMPNAGDTGYELRITQTTGLAHLGLGDGTARTYVSTVSVASVGISANDRFWLRATWDQSAGTVKFYYSTDSPLTAAGDVSWTQLGADVTGAITSSLSTNTDPVYIGSFNTTFYRLVGQTFRALVISGLGGSAVMDVDFADATAPYSSFTESANSLTVSINYATSGYPGVVVHNDLFQFDGANDVIAVPDHADLDFGASDDFTLIAWFRPGRVSATEAVVSKYASSVGYYLQNVSGTPTVGCDSSGSGTDTHSALTARTSYTLALVRNTTDDDVEAFVDGVGSGTPGTDATTGSLANANALEFGVLQGSLQDYFGDLMAVALFNTALTDSDVADIDTELTTGVAASSGARTQLQQGQLGTELRSGA